MSEYEKTTTPNMVIDKSTGAVLNTDIGAYAAIKRAREEYKKGLAVFDRIDALEREVNELKALVMGLRKEQDNRD